MDDAIEEITPEILLSAYAAGFFPMALSRDDPQLYWFSPEERGVIPLDAFHTPRRLARTMRASPFEIRVNSAFRDVIGACADERKGASETWINASIAELYGTLHDMGFAHSVECWREGKLAGGLYGVALAGVFFGESMFSRERDASKIALMELLRRLTGAGYGLLDTQYVTPHLSRFGAVAIAREAYLEKLGQALALRPLSCF
jgi:leucyl/phenylalanyl-tRNA--protein transferase